MFTVRAISVGNVVMLLAGACLMPMWYFLSLYMQEVLHDGALKTGLGFLPHTAVAILVGAQVAPWVMRHINGRALIVAGALVAAAGFWWQSDITPHSGYLSAILGPAIVISIGGGLLNTPVTATVTSGIADADAGAASGLMNTTKQFGGALGLAALVAVSEAHDHAPGDVATGYSRAFLAIAAILVVVAVTALGLPGRGRHRPDRSVPPTPADEVRPQSDDEATQCGTTC